MTMTMTMTKKREERTSRRGDEKIEEGGGEWKNGNEKTNKRRKEGKEGMGNKERRSCKPCLFIWMI